MSSIEKEWKTGRVLRLNIVSSVNQAYADKIGVSDTPTFILFDPSGQEMKRWHREAPALADLP